MQIDSKSIIGNESYKLYSTTVANTVHKHYKNNFFYSNLSRIGFISIVSRYSPTLAKNHLMILHSFVNNKIMFDLIKSRCCSKPFFVCTYCNHSSTFNSMIKHIMEEQHIWRRIVDTIDREAWNKIVIQTMNAEYDKLPNN